ncbi:hypothetical protein SAMN04487913_110181 [Arthrobacter sp. ok362]|nr:hypothetical protein SAMN04487913_110181 [Arthrobacter sp. ok362]
MPHGAEAGLPIGQTSRNIFPQVRSSFAFLQAAAILILVFGQQAGNIARLTWDDVTITEELVTIQLGTIKIALPEPLAQPWRELSANPRHDLTAAHPNTT